MAPTPPVAHHPTALEVVPLTLIALDAWDFVKLTRDDDIRKRRMFVQEVADRELYIDIPEVFIGKTLARVCTRTTYRK